MSWTAEWKEARLKALRNEWKGCTKCTLSGGRDKIVFGVGPSDANIMIIGEAPGNEEDVTGKPFVGDSGRLLSSMLESVCANRHDFYITNVVMCHPPSNREPIKEEKVACLPRLFEEIYIVDPILIILAGKTATSLLTGCRDPMEKLVGELTSVKVPGKSLFGGKPIKLIYDAMPIYHPAYILRNDSRNPKTGKWAKGNVATQTCEHLKHALTLVSNLRGEYARALKWRKDDGEKSEAVNEQTGP